MEVERLTLLSRREGLPSNGASKNDIGADHTGTGIPLDVCDPDNEGSCAIRSCREKCR